jgi:serine/threonine protein kinase
VLVESLGRYRIDKELGRGAMGQVFLAYDPQIERRVAIKTIQIFAQLPEADRQQARDRFLREARSAGKLLHPGIVTVFDVGEAGGVPYLAMEFVEGQTLDAFCREDTLLPVPVVVSLIAAAADALAFAHERGIVHRDVKPANLMRVGETRAKIMDFGLAKSPATQMTHDGALMGTPSYMAPEQVRGDALDGRADLFSLAVVLYEMLIGEKPFGGDSVSSVLYRIVHEAPKDPALRLDRVPAPLAAFLQTALSKNPGDRFPDGKAFAEALQQSGRASTPIPRMKPAPGASLPDPEPHAPKPSSARPARPAHRPPPAPTPPRRSLVPYVVLAALAVAGIATAVIFVQRRGGVAAPPLVEARVRTEPPGIAIRFDGATLTGNVVKFAAAGPFGVLTAAQGCREAKHRLDAADAGSEIVLVLDPQRAPVPVDAGRAGAAVTVNGSPAGATPVTLDLDLCRDNAVVAQAEGFRPATVTIPKGATPLEARNAAAALKLLSIPTGRLMLPATRFPVRFLVDGKPVERNGRGVEVPAGTHEVRAVNDDHFVEVAGTVDVPEGGSAAPSFTVPPLAGLTVQTFPPNAETSLKKGSSAWRTIGETPLRIEVGAGRYTLRVRSPLTDEMREQEIELRAGPNPPIRVAFGRGGR